MKGQGTITDRGKGKDKGKKPDQGKGKGKKPDQGKDGNDDCVISLPTFNIITLNNADSLITIDFGQSINYKNNNSNNKCLILSLAYAANISPCELLYEITRTINNLQLDNDDYRNRALADVTKSLQNNDFIDFIALVQLINFTGLFPNGLICLNLKPTTVQTEIYFGNINLKTPTIINVGSYHFFCAHSDNYSTSAKMVIENKERFNDYTDTVNDAPITTTKPTQKFSGGGPVITGGGGTAAAAGGGGTAAAVDGSDGDNNNIINIKSTSFEGSSKNKNDFVKSIKGKIANTIKVEDKTYNYNMVEYDNNDTSTITLTFKPSQIDPYIGNIGVNLNKQLASSREQTTNYLDQLLKLSKNQALPDGEKKPNKRFFPFYKKQFPFKRARTKKDAKRLLEQNKRKTRKELAKIGVLSNSANLREAYKNTKDQLNELFNPPKVVNADTNNNDDNDSLSFAIAIAIAAGI